MSRKWSDYVTAVPNNNTPVIKVKDNVTRQSKSYVESSFVKRKLSPVTGCSKSKANCFSPGFDRQSLCDYVIYDPQQEQTIRNHTLIVGKRAAVTPSDQNMKTACTLSRLNMKYLNDLKTNENGKDEHLYIFVLQLKINSGFMSLQRRYPSAKRIK